MSNMRPGGLNVALRLKLYGPLDKYCDMIDYYWVETGLKLD